ncbi:MAG: hypothetical protein P8X74_03880 [Reinekea sp.]
MTKQYKIVIPENGLTKEQLQIMGNEDLSIGYFTRNDGKIFNPEEIPGHWPDFLLEEIEQPTAAEKWVKDRCVILNPREVTFDYNNIIEAFNAGAEDEKQKHAQKQTFEQCKYKRVSTSKQYDFGYLHGWEDYEENRGYND